MKSMSFVLTCLLAINFAVAAEGIDYKELAKADVERMLKIDPKDAPTSEIVDPKVAHLMEKLSLEHASNADELGRIKLVDLNFNDTVDTCIMVCCGSGQNQFCRMFFGDNNWSQYGNALAYFQANEGGGQCCSADFYE